MHALKRSTPAGALRVNFNSDWSGLALVRLGEVEAEIPGAMARAIVDAIPPTDCRKACCYCHESYKAGDAVWRTTSGRMLMCSDCAREQGGGGLAGHYPEITKDDDHEELDRLRAEMAAEAPRPRDPDLVRLVAALAPLAPWLPWGVRRNDDDDHVVPVARSVVERARAILAEIDRPTEGAKP